MPRFRFRPSSKRRRIRRTAGKIPLPPIAFNLSAAAGKNVRVRGSGYGAGLDIGVAGKVHLQGTLASPQLDGTIKSTGGTLTYFDRAFRVQEGSVAFDPSDGVLPTIHAVATTSVVNPDPDRARNPYGSAEISIKVDGPDRGLEDRLHHRTRPAIRATRSSR